jgi:hypothetical protein
MPSSGRQPFEEASEPLNSTMHAQLLATVKSHRTANQHSQSPSQPRRQAESKLPPFVEAALSRSLRPNATAIPTAAVIPESALCASNGPGVPRTAEIQSSEPNRSELRLVVEPIVADDVQESLIPSNHPDRPGNAAQALPGDTDHGKLDRGDILRPSISDRALPESKPVLRALPTNHRPRSHNKNADNYTSRHGTNKLPPSRPPNRPLAEHQLQPQDIHGNQDLHGTQNSKVLKRGLSRSKTAHHIQSNGRIPIGGSGPIDSADMFQMAAVMATAEREQREQVVAKAHLQEVQIVNLSNENTALQNKIEILSKENEELFEKHAGFRTRYERYKTHMNDVTRTQKELHAAAQSLSQRRFEALNETAKEMDAELLKAKVLASEKSGAILKEARLKLDRRRLQNDDQQTGLTLLRRKNDRITQPRHQQPTP